MKILVLSPVIDSEHPSIRELRRLGVAVLSVKQPLEAWQMLQLHGRSIDLALVHREDQSGKGEAGLNFVNRFKNDKQHEDLPYILITQEWDDGNCAEHQETPLGANAYLRWPLVTDSVMETIEAVTGKRIAEVTRLTKMIGTQASAVDADDEALEGTSIAISPLMGDGNDEKTGTAVMLEDAEEIFTGTSIRMPTSGDASQPSIVLQAPELDGLDDEQVVEDATSAIPSPPSSPSEHSMPDIEIGEIVEEDPSEIIHDTSEELAAQMDQVQEQADDEFSEGTARLEVDHPDEELEVEHTEDLPPPPGTEVVQEEATSLVMIPMEEDGTAEIVHEGQGLHDIDGPPPIEADSSGEHSIDLDAPLSSSDLEIEHEEIASSPPPFTKAIDTSSMELTPIEEQLEHQDLSLDDSMAEIDPEAAREMPYLFGDDSSTSTPSESSARGKGPVIGENLDSFQAPLGDAIVPGGAAQSPDLETLKRYLMLREQDVGALSAQMKTLQEENHRLNESLQIEKGRGHELEHQAREQSEQLEEINDRHRREIAEWESQVEELKFELRAKSDKVELMEEQIHQSAREIEKIKERVKQDIRNIRSREKELENRLEIVKKDSEMIIAARENQIVELKRKIDLLEFNLDLGHDQNAQQKDLIAELRKKLEKVSRALRVAGGLIEQSTGKDLPPFLNESGDTGQYGDDEGQKAS